MPVKRWNFCSVKWKDITLTKKFEKTFLLLKSPDVKTTCQDAIATLSQRYRNAIAKHPKRLFHAVTKTNVRRIGMKSVKLSIKLYCSALK